MRFVPPTLAALACAACSDEPGPTPGPTPPAPDPLPVVDVVDARIAALREDPAASPPPTPETDEGTAELARGLATMRAGDARMAPLTEDDARAAGPGVVPPLAELVADGGAPAAERRAAAELLAAVPHGAALDALVATASNADEAWLRRIALWCLGRSAAPDRERVLPELLLRLKYESDDEAFVWLAETLAGLGNGAGLDALAHLAARPAGAPAADAARAALARVGAALAPEGDEPLDGAALREAWERGGAPFDERAAPAGPALRLRVWELVSDTAVENFQLRGVDDARWTLSNLGPWAARLFAEALADDDPSIRLYTAQILERMGGRARAASGRLVRALDDAHPGVAAGAAEALGAVGGPNALDALLSRTGPATPHDLRVACVRGAGRLGGPAALDRLAALAHDEAAPVDLRLAAADGLVRAGRGEGVVPFLRAQLEDPIGDPGGAEAALGRWLARAAADDPDRYGEAHADWLALAPPAERVHDAAEVRARRAARAAIVDRLIAR